MERTLVLLKPDCVQRRLVGEVIGRLEAKGLKIAAMKMLRVSPQQARRMYAEHEGKYFHAPLVTFITSSPVVAMVVEGTEAVAVCRAMLGPTDGKSAPAGTVRGDYGLSSRNNLVHASDSPASADRETAIFFAPGEVLEYELGIGQWIWWEPPARGGPGPGGTANPQIGDTG